jgi:monoamine oxidase
MADQVLIRLHAFYPQARGAFTGYEIRRYSTDPGTGGAYLAFGPGQISKFWRLWERPVQRVVFAGEHTDALYPGTLEGALRSGQRAAGQVQGLSAGKSFDPVSAVPAAGAAAVVAKESKGGFFSNLFGGSDKAVSKPVEKVAEAAPQPAPAPVAPVVAPVTAPAPVAAPQAKAEPVKAAPVKKAQAKAQPAKKPVAKTEAAKKSTAQAKPAPAKAQASKKPEAKPAAVADAKS